MYSIFTTIPNISFSAEKKVQNGSVRRGSSYTGLVFGKLTVLEETENAGNWLCQCTCGKKTIVKRFNLKVGATRSCGCGRVNQKPPAARKKRDEHPAGRKMIPKGDEQ